jgi:hypothetical protein
MNLADRSLWTRAAAKDPPPVLFEKSKFGFDPYREGADVQRSSD